MAIFSKSVPVAATVFMLLSAIAFGGCGKEKPQPSPTPTPTPSPEREQGGDNGVDMSADILPLITDPAWRAYCIEQMKKEGGWDKAGDEVLSSWESNFVTSISVPSLGIKELQALKYFHGLESLDCRGNELTALDLSESYLLKSLNCENNLLTGLTIYNAFNLETLAFSGNPGKEGKFVVTAWFDNSSVPAGFPTGSWNYDGQTVAIEYVEIVW